MLENNPGIDKNILKSVGNLFDPDKVYSLYKQQAFKRNDMLHIFSVDQITLDHSRKGNTDHNRNERNNSNLPIFDPFKMTQQLMGTPHMFHMTSSVNILKIPPEVTSQTSTTNLKFSNPILAPFASTSAGSSFFNMTTKDTSGQSPSISTEGARVPLQTTEAQPTAAKPAKLHINKTFEQNRV